MAQASARGSRAGTSVPKRPSASVSRFPPTSVATIRKPQAIASSKAFEEPSSCEACGSSFTCGASLTGCWCWKVKLTDEDRARLRSSYSKCLCPACLELASHRGTEL